MLNNCHSGHYYYYYYCIVNCPCPVVTNVLNWKQDTNAINKRNVGERKNTLSMVHTQCMAYNYVSLHYHRDTRHIWTFNVSQSAL